MENEICEHKWRDEQKYREFVGRAGNAILGGEDHFRIIILQRCEKCGKLNKV